MSIERVDAGTTRLSVVTILYDSSLEISGDSTRVPLLDSLGNQPGPSTHLRSSTPSPVTDFFDPCSRVQGTDASSWAGDPTSGRV